MRISDWSSDVCSSDLDSETGATIAVPATMPIKSEAGFCLAESALGDVGLIFHGQVFNPNLTNLQSVSVQFDTAVSQVLGLAYCEPDPLLVERSEEHTSELQSLMSISYAVFCLKKKKKRKTNQHTI